MKLKIRTWKLFHITKFIFYLSINKNNKQLPQEVQTLL